MKMVINGELVDKNDKIDIFNPYNNKIVDRVPSGTLEDIKNALKAANDAKPIMSEMSSRKISRIMYDIYNELSKSSDELAKLITLETGKPISDSRDEIKRSLETILLSAEESKRIYGETVPMDACIGGRSALGFTMQVPIGVLSAITPFNYPVNLAIHKIAPAIAAKNTVVLKPSIKAPLAALKLTQIMAEHLPAGAINTVTGYSSEIGDEMIISPLVDKISFTGSIGIGESISKKAGMKKLTLELGGNDPLVVLEDADIDKAVIAAVRGSYLNAGQVCIAVKRIILQDSIANEFVEKMVSETSKLINGDPMKTETDVGPLIDEESAIKVEKNVNEAIFDGAELLLGGERRGAFYTPTILDHVKPEMNIVVDETFGPVSPILRVKSVDDAFKMANNTQYGLQAGVFTKSIENAMQAAKTIEAGSVMINKQSTFRTDNMPFGGFKISGLGKEGVKYAVADMTKTKLIVFG